MFAIWDNVAIQCEYEYEGASKEAEFPFCLRSLL